MEKINARELWGILEKSNDNEIMTLITSSIMYLSMKRDYEVKSIISEIKRAIKYTESHR